MSLVLDCSIAVTWCFEDEATPETDALLDRAGREGAVVPGLWHLEIGNVLIQAVRRGRLARGELASRIELLRKLPLKTDTETAGRALRETLTLAIEHGLTTYDASYLELATRLALPLATKNSELHRAAAEVHVDLLPHP